MRASGPVRPAGLAGDVLARLIEVVGDRHVLTEPDLTASYVTDWSGRFVGSTPAVVRPGSVAEVAAVLVICHGAGVAVVPQGGNTGLVGGGVALAGEVVLSLRRLAAIEAVDELAGQVTAGAGATVADVQRAAAAAGWAYGVDFAARDTATVGGSVATNAGGVRVLRHGMTRRQVLGVEAVLADGRVLRHLGGLVKDNTGYDLTGLLCGSEGTLAVITAARLRLVPAVAHRVAALLAFPAAALAVDAVTTARRALESLEAAELFFADGLELVCRHSGARAPFGATHAAYLLLECGGPTDPTEALAAVVGGLPGVADVAVATDGPRRAELWHYREALTEAIGTLGTVHKLDVSLPASRLVEFLERVAGRVDEVAVGARTVCFGHVADGNVHVNVVGPAAGDESVDVAVLELAAGMGGSISAEHGVGTAKAGHLHLSRSAEELAVFASVKHALDPRGILNPHALLAAT